MANEKTGFDFENLKKDLFHQLMQQTDDLIDDLGAKISLAQSQGSPVEEPSAEEPNKTDAGFYNRLDFMKGSPKSGENVPTSSVPTSTTAATSAPVLAKRVPPVIKQSSSSLPWFKHGVRGFLRKLWHGDSKENPDWASYENFANFDKLTLQEYVVIESGFHNELNQLINEAGFADAFANYFNQFKTNLLKAIQSYAKKLEKAAYEQGYNNARSKPREPEVVELRGASPRKKSKIDKLNKPKLSPSSAKIPDDIRRQLDDLGSEYEEY